MSNRKTLLIFPFLIILYITIMGCSTGSSLSPEIPIAWNNSEGFPVLVSDWDSQGRPLEGMGLLGAFFLDIDTQKLTCDVTPIRHGSLVDSLEVIDITNFLTLVPCRDCIRIGAVGLDYDGHLVLSIGIKHPFPVGVPILPITGRNRIDLHVFNVEGLFAITEPFLPLSEFPTAILTVARKGLINASGYTPYLDETLEYLVSTEADIHPYILHFRDYTAGNYAPFFDTGFEDVFNPSGNLVMAQGCDYDYRDYIVDIDPGVNYRILYAVECSYGVSAETFEFRFTPEYRVPQYNKKAASEVFVSVKNNLLMEGNTSSTAIVEVEVLDMNHGTSVGVGISQMSADSSVAEIFIEVPDIMSAPIQSINPVAQGGTPRDPLDPLHYELTIGNELGASEGTYLGLVAVVDAFLPGQNTHPFLIGQDGGYRMPPPYSPLDGLFEIDKFVTYQVFEYEVLPSITFTQRALVPTTRFYARAAVVDDLIYVIGGTTDLFSPDEPKTNVIEAYDPVANTWTTSLTPMPTARAGMAVAAVGDNIYVIGGQRERGSGNTTVNEIYDTVGDSWSTGTSIPDPLRHGLECAVKDTVIFVAGGFNTVDKDQKTLYRYDTVSGGWGRLPDMSAVRSQFAMTIKGDFIYVVGGQPVLGPGSDMTPYVEVFDTVNMMWSLPNSLPKLDTPVLGPRWENVNDDVILVGGAINSTTLENRVFIYDEINESFIESGQLLIPRTSFASATWNGRIYLFSGLALSTDDPPVPFITTSTEEGMR